MFFTLGCLYLLLLRELQMNANENEYVLIAKCGSRAPVPYARTANFVCVAGLSTLIQEAQA
uniref:Uncharacterized protein n=1 Tax=Candidatus Kentrum sp. FM TaxID=2126340 RepID=A0A450S5L6_9GAMM|nr:MAG: hypothetical protein BECKFM1743C_GA0114222_100424 [Candidatus Kentron sp. FM]VFJ49945.1 MAG: hypothetical protein BECKFM1743A_GA0114220_100782 [Candidatus Kentron sp. FM]VFK08418.1 MAG: hypothetical protein BECKFM1743B_GA0114221_100692 [Candidatus Kentron sp. FM]